MKFYYNGELVRTSKNHNYTHAILTPNGIASCSSRKETAESEIRALKSEAISRVEHCEYILKEFDAGKDFYFSKSKRVSIKNEMPKDRATIEQWLKWAKETLEYRNQFRVVELECRA